jgi:CHRD domain-containing protein
MKRLAIPVAIVVTLGLAGCGSNSSTSPSPSTTTVFTVQLSPANEVPPVTDAEASGRGTAIITVHSDTNTVDFNVSVTNFPTSTQIILAHIHGPNAPAGVNAGVLVNTNINSTNPVNAGIASNGSGTFSVTGQSPASGGADTINQILANPQNFYFNVHSTAHGGGVMRGQLR